MVYRTSLFSSPIHSGVNPSIPTKNHLHVHERWDSLKILDAFSAIKKQSKALFS